MAHEEATDHPPVTEPGGRSGPFGGPHVLVAILFGLAALPVVVALVALADRHWFPTGDMAQAELHVRGIWQHPPLVGAAGRITSTSGVQGSHPGPSLWFAMYPVYALFGRTSFGLMAGAASVHLASFAAALWLARRRGGTSLMLLVGLLLVILIRSSGPFFFIEPWNPWLAVFPFLVFVLVCWELAEGRGVMVVPAVVLGSHAVQSHTGYLVIVLGLLGASTAAGGLALWRSRGAGPVIRWGFAGLLSGVAMWLLPIIDQLTRSPGNMTILAENFASPDEPYVAKGLVMRAVGSQLSLLGPWLTGPSLIERNLPAVVLTFGLWATALRIALRRRDRRALTLHALLGLGVVLALFSVERIFGSYLEYTIRWFWVLAGLIVVAAVWTLWSGRPHRSRVPAAVLLAGTVAFSVVAAVQFGTRADLSGRPDSELVGAVIDQVDEALPPGAYLVRWFDPVGLGAVPFGLVLELARRGYDTGVDGQFAAAALPQRVLPEAEADGVLYVVLGPKADEVRAAGLREIGSADLRSAAQIARSAELESQLRDGFAAIGRPELIERLDSQYGRAGLLFVQPALPIELADAISELVALRLPVTVFLAPPGTPIPF